MSAARRPPRSEPQNSHDFPSESHAAQPALGGIVRHADAPVFEEQREGRPALEHVVDGLHEVVPARQFGRLLAHVGHEIVDQRPALRAANRQALLGALAVDRRARWRTARRCGAPPRWRSARAGSPSFPTALRRAFSSMSAMAKNWTPGMRPTRRLQDRAGLAVRQIELVVAVVGVGLQDAGVAGEMRLRMFAAAVARVIEDRRGRPGAAERPVVAHVDPEPAGVGLALGQHRHGRASRPRGFHPRPLPEPGVRLSPHPAPIRPARRLRQVASARTIVGFHARSSRGKSRARPNRWWKRLNLRLIQTASVWSI